MGSIVIIKPLSIYLSNIKLFSGERRIEPGAAGCEARTLSIVSSRRPTLSTLVVCDQQVSRLLEVNLVRQSSWSYVMNIVDPKAKGSYFTCLKGLDEC